MVERKGEYNMEEGKADDDFITKVRLRKLKDREEAQVIRRRFVITQITAVIVTLIIGITVWVVTWRITPEKYASVKNEFFRQVEKQITLGTVENAEDVEMIRIGVSREKDSEKLRLDDLQGLLTEYLVWVSLDKAADEEQQVKQAKAMKAILKEVTSEKPFSVLPEEDQLTAIELKNSIESGDKDAALSRMQLLTASLGKEISSLKRRTEGSWRWTIYSALIGGIGIVVTIVLFLLYRGVSRSREFDNLMGMLEDLRNEVVTMQYKMGLEEKEGQSP